MSREQCSSCEAHPGSVWRPTLQCQHKHLVSLIYALSNSLKHALARRHLVIDQQALSYHTKPGHIHLSACCLSKGCAGWVGDLPVTDSVVQQHTSILFWSSSSEGLPSPEGPAPALVPTPACAEGVPVRPPAALLVEVIPCLRSQGGRAFPGTASRPSALPPSAPESKGAKSMLVTLQTVVVSPGQPLHALVWSCYCMSNAEPHMWQTD